jgi:hypothetical protein
MFDGAIAFSFGVNINTSYIPLAKSCHTTDKIQIRRAPVSSQPKGTTMPLQQHSSLTRFIF